MRGIVIIYLLIGMVNLNEILVKKYYVDIDLKQEKYVCVIIVNFQLRFLCKKWVN